MAACPGGSQTGLGQGLHLLVIGGIGSPGRARGSPEARHGPLRTRYVQWAGRKDLPFSKSTRPVCLGLTTGPQHQNPGEDHTHFLDVQTEAQDGAEASDA